MAFYANLIAVDDRGRLLEGAQEMSKATAYAEKVAVDDEVRF